jgi:hypothetical protein
MAFHTWLHPDGRLFVHQPHRPYEYLSYDFSNKSREIVDIRRCMRPGRRRVPPRGPSTRGMWDVRINRRASVQLMLANVGVKT